MATHTLVRRRTLFEVHSWVGITAGLMLFVISWSGTVAVVSHEIDWLLNPTLRAPAAQTPIDWEAIMRRVTHHYPDWHIEEINEPLYPGFAVEVHATPPGSARHRVYVDPTTVQVIGSTSYFNVQRFFRSFHMALFENDEGSFGGIPVGYYVVGVFSLFLLSSVISGLAFYRKWWRGLFMLQTRHGARRLFADLHKLTGLWQAWFGLLIGLTGFWYLLEWWVPEPPYVEVASVAAPGTPSLNVTDLVQKAHVAYPELVIQRVGFYEDGVITFEGDDGSTLVRKRAAYVSVDQRTGQVVALQRPATLSAYDRWWETVDLLHFGKFGGVWSKALYVVFGLALSGLCLTGAYLRAQRQRRDMIRREFRRSVYGAYGLTVLLMLYAVYGGYQEIKGYGTGNAWPEVPAPVLLFLLGWGAITLVVLGGWMRLVDR